MRRKCLLILMSILLILSMLSMVACSKNEEKVDDRDLVSTQDETQSGTDENSSSSKEQETVNYDPLGKYDPSIEFRYVAVNTTNQEFPAGDSFEENVWTRGYLEELGIKFIPEWIARTNEQYTQKLGVMIASDSMPDAWVCDNNNTMFMLAESGKIQDLTEAYNNYASEGIREQLEFNYVTLDSATIGGKLMAIPVPSEPFPKYLWYRIDWLDNLGLQPPKTINDVIELAYAFTNDDPDKNGKDDTFGLPLDNDFTFLGEGFFAGYYTYPVGDFWCVKDNELVFGGIQQELKEPLGKLKQMFADGIIDHEFIVKDRGAVYNDIAAEKFGLLFGERWNPSWPLNTVKENNPDSDWDCTLIVDEEGNYALSPAQVKPKSYFVVNSKYDYPEALVKMCNFYFDKIYKIGVEQGEYNQVKVGDKVIVQKHLGVFNIPRIGFYIDDTELVLEALDSKDTSKLTGSLLNIYKACKAYIDGDHNVANWVQFKRSGPKGAFFKAKKAIDDNLFIYNQYYGPTFDIYLQKASTLSDFKIESMIEIITGEKELSYFDEYVENWNTLGGKEITQKVNDWYNNR